MGSRTTYAGMDRISQSLPFSPAGKVFIVGDSDTAGYNDIVQKFGHNISAWYGTIDAAISACTANRGDVIFIAPNHTETVTATSIALDIAGVRIIGLGQGLNRPTFTFGAAAATITVTGANCSWENCHFIGNFLDVAAAFTIGAAKDFSLVNNTFVDNTASLGFLSIVVTGATDNEADGLNVVGNYWYSLDLSPNAFVSILAAELRLNITDNYCNMAATNDVGHFITLSSKIVKGVKIARNRLVVVGSTGAAVGIFLTGSGSTSNGIVENNYVSSLDTTGELIATAGTGLVYFENYYTGVADASGKLWPVVDAA